MTNEKYPITECFNVVRNLWVTPKYEELFITAEAWLKITAFINLVGDYEVSGFARIQELKDEDGEVNAWVTDVDILEQEVKALYVESTPMAVAKFMMTLPKDQIKEWTLDWHSHVNIGTTPSGTDWTNYSDMLKARMNKQFPIMIVNKKGEVTSYDIISDTRHTPIKISVEQKELSEEEIKALYEECKEKVEQKCKRAPVTQVKTYSASYWDKAKGRVDQKTYKNNWWGAKAGYDYTDEDDYYDDEDEDIIRAKQEGYVFDDMDTSQVMYCEECGAELVSKREEELGVCLDCWRKAITK